MGDPEMKVKVKYACCPDCGGKRKYCRDEGGGGHIHDDCKRCGGAPGPLEEWISLADLKRALERN